MIPRPPNPLIVALDVGDLASAERLPPSVDEGDLLVWVMPPEGGVALGEILLVDGRDARHAAVCVDLRQWVDTTR